MKKIIITLLLFVHSTYIFACLNLYVINEDGQVNYYDNRRPYEIIRTDSAYFLDKLKWYEKRIPTVGVGLKDMYISNYSVYLVHLGKNKEALEILQKLAKKKPNEYQILANLATAYELNGNLDSALFYIKRSLQVNPYSHEESEWFHVAYLTKALAIRDKGETIDGRNILQLGTGYSEATGSQLARQLSERMPLTDAPNQLLSKMIEETADYFKKYISIDWSVKFYAMALAYAADDVAQKRIAAKIDKTIERILVLNETNAVSKRRTDPVRDALLKKDRKQYIQKDIDKWKNYKAISVQEIKVLEFPDL